MSYGYDEQSTETADQNFKILMERLTTIVPAERINIIAHSMGSRLVLSYIEGLPLRSIFPDEIKFQNLVFAASDVAQDLFQQKVPNPLMPDYPISVYADEITVYSSQYDRPLWLSKKLHGGGRPLGLADPTSMFLAPGITAVDASAIDPARWYQRFSFATRHSYVFNKAAGARDLSLLFSGQGAAMRPNMTKRTRGTDIYWGLSLGPHFVFDNGAGDDEVKFDTGVAGALQIGDLFDDLRTDIEFSHSRSDVDSHPFDIAFVVALARPAELVLEQIVRL